MAIFVLAVRLGVGPGAGRASTHSDPLPLSWVCSTGEVFATATFWLLLNKPGIYRGQQWLDDQYGISDETPFFASSKFPALLCLCKQLLKEC